MIDKIDITQERRLVLNPACVKINHKYKYQ